LVIIPDYDSMRALHLVNRQHQTFGGSYIGIVERAGFDLAHDISSLDVNAFDLLAIDTTVMGQACRS